MDTAKLMALMKAKKQALKQKAKTLKPNPGANRYILLPGWRKGEEAVFWHDFGQHYVKNAAGEIQAVYVCADKTFGNPCPICDALGKASRMTSDEDTVNLLKEAASGQSFLMNVLALDSDDDAAPQILEVRKSVFGQVVELIEEWGASVFDPTMPQIITINRDGKGLMTKYSVQISPKKHALPKCVLSKLNDLDDYVKQENEEQQRRAISAINTAAGLLPAVSSKDKPVTASSVLDDQDADLRGVEQRNAAAASKPAHSDIALDEELDDLLGDLTGTGD